MWPVLRLFLNVALLRSGPEQVPDVKAFLWLMLIASAALNLLVFSIDGRFAAMDLVLLLLAMYFLLAVNLFVLLRFKGRAALFGSTLTSLVGVDALFKSLLLPIFLMANQLTADSSARGLIESVLLLLSLWSLTVEGFIYSRAAKINWTLGLLIALMLTLIFFKFQMLLISEQPESLSTIAVSTIAVSTIDNH